MTDPHHVYQSLEPTAEPEVFACSGPGCDGCRHHDMRFTSRAAAERWVAREQVDA